MLGWSSFSRGRTARRAADADGRGAPSVLSLPHKRYVTSARVAIALALQRLGVGPGDRVLVPAYHCLSMVEPIVFCGAEPCFFPLTPDLEVPLDALERFDLSRVRAMLVTHYFGFPQAMASICAFAQRSTTSASSRTARMRSSAARTSGRSGRGATTRPSA